MSSADDIKELESRAEKKLRSWFGKQSATEEAAELYTQIGNKYKIRRQFMESGRAFEKAAGCYEKFSEDTNLIASQYLEAARVYLQVSHDDYIRTQEKAISIEMTNYQYRQAAQHLKNCAEVCEGSGDFDRAIKHYVQAADFFRLEDNAKSSVQACQQKLAVIHSLHKQDYKKAAELYESLGKAHLETPLTRFGARECFFKASICYLMLKDAEVVKEKVASFESQDPNLTKSFELKLINSLIEALEESDEEKFTSAVGEYDSVHRLDPWTTQTLLRLKEIIKEENEGTTL